MDFARLLEDSFFYKNNEYAVEPEDKIDMTVKKNGTVKVLMEFKRPKNVSEMIKRNDLNRKALHEALAYFYTEKNLKNNYEIRTIIISNGKEFFIFDPSSFLQKPLQKVGNAISGGDLFSDKADFTYQLFKQIIQRESVEFDYTYFTIDELKSCSKSRLIAIFKTLHPDFLLREFSHRDSNQLNGKFYTELLHILGLKEIRKGGKILIQVSTSGGLINETIEQLATDKGIYNTKQAFEIAFELTITWMNRLIFLKLFESQLVSFNNNNFEYKFLTSSQVKNYDDLNNLFFKILGRPIKERAASPFNRIPYLNSSLFEVSEIEKKYFSISSLDNNAQTQIYKFSNLRKWDEYKSKKKEFTLKYFLDFLESYSFSSVDDGELLNKSSSEIINPAVLGLIFEKLNGYKEGSFFTPGYITGFISAICLEKAVIQKFNEALGIEVSNIDELINYIGSPVYRSSDLLKYNNIVNSLSIVDPAVGSGHFLVSALNYIIYIKSRLGILWDGKNRISEEIEIVDDSLCVYSGDQLFSYKRNKPETHRLQKALFKEKQTIIENCLFGVDINEKSVNICQLRLWIELLKNAYYIQANSDEMELLPNIDINIKCGNSLVSKYKPLPGRAITKTGEGKKTKELIDRYKLAVAKYKHSGDKKDKQIIKDDIQKIKANIYMWIQPDLFKADAHLNYLPDNAFEWLVEFPELLDPNGKFSGFDVILGNPPYIKESDNKELFVALKNNSYYQGKMDIWYYFACRAMDLLKSRGLLSFIATNNWITNDGASILRQKLLAETTLKLYVDFGDNQIFDSASIQTMIFLAKKEKSKSVYDVPYYRVNNFVTHSKLEGLLKQIIDNQPKSSSLLHYSSKLDPKKLGYIRFSSIETESLLNKIAMNSDHLLPAEIFSGIDVLQDKVNKKAHELLPHKKIGEGVFVLSEEEVRQLNLSSEEKVDVLRPYYTTNEIKKYGISKSNTEWIIYTDSSYNDAEKINKYPAIKKHLDSFASIITSVNKPYGLHRPRKESIFKGTKIFSIRKGFQPSFTYSEGDTFVSRAFLIIKTKRFDNLYLTGLLNSKLVAFWLKEKGKIQGQNFQIDKEPLLNIPIKDSSSFKEGIIDKVKLLVNSPNVDSSFLQKEIDDLVYKIYNLSDVEISLIEGSII